MELQEETHDSIVTSHDTNEQNRAASPENGVMEKLEPKRGRFPWATLIVATAIVAICALGYQMYIKTGRCLAAYIPDGVVLALHLSQQDLGVPNEHCDHVSFG
jgi:hypothetical protein